MLHATAFPGSFVPGATGSLFLLPAYLHQAASTDLASLSTDLCSADENHSDSSITLEFALTQLLGSNASHLEMCALLLCYLPVLPQSSAKRCFCSHQLSQATKSRASGGVLLALSEVFRLSNSILVNVPVFFAQVTSFFLDSSFYLWILLTVMAWCLLFFLILRHYSVLGLFHTLSSHVTSVLI